MPDAPILIALIAWGGLVGMDLVSFPQALFSRPIVAGTVAGLLTGDLEAGLRVGVLLELFALEVLPIGATRYPDFGPATVVAASVAAGAEWREALGPAVLLALVLAKVGGAGMERLRRWNGEQVRAAEPALVAGEAAVLARLQHRGLAGDLLRGAAVTALGLTLALLSRQITPHLPAVGPSLTLVTIAGGLVAAAGGLSRRAGGRAQRRWAAAGLTAGAVVAWLNF